MSLSWDITRKTQKWKKFIESFYFVKRYIMYPPKGLPTKFKPSPTSIQFIENKLVIWINFLIN